MMMLRLCFTAAFLSLVSGIGTVIAAPDRPESPADSRHDAVTVRESTLMEGSLALAKTDAHPCSTRPRGALQEHQLIAVFWKPLVIVANEAGICDVNVINTHVSCLQPADNLIGLSMRLFYSPQRATGSTLSMVAMGGDGNRVERGVSTPTTMPLPPEQVMPYPVAGIGDEGFPLVWGPISSDQGGQALVRWSLQTNRINEEAIFVLIHRDELIDLLRVLQDDVLAEEWADAVPRSILFVQDLLVGVSGEAGTRLLQVFGYKAESRPRGREQLTRRFQSLYRFMNADPEKEWRWLRLEMLP